MRLFNRQSKPEPVSVSRLSRMSSGELKALLTGDPATAYQWIKAAAEHGLPEAQIRLGRMLLDGTGIPADPAAALGWFRVAARHHDADAMNMIGRCLENGWGVEVDLAGAASWYQKAASAGHDWGQYNLGHMYLEGRGVKLDRDLALRWYLASARQGHPRAMNLAARCYEEGWGTAPDPATAREWYRRSAEGGYFRGHYNYATILAREGRIAEARHWFRQAAETGPLAMARTVAQMLIASGPPLWDGLGIEILTLCCERGDASDCHRLSRVLERGLHGTPDPQAAAHWLARAQAAEAISSTATR